MKRIILLISLLASTWVITLGQPMPGYTPIQVEEQISERTERYFFDTTCDGLLYMAVREDTDKFSTYFFNEDSLCAEYEMILPWSSMPSIQSTMDGMYKRAAGFMWVDAKHRLVWIATERMSRRYGREVVLTSYSYDDKIKALSDRRLRAP